MTAGRGDQQRRWKKTIPGWPPDTSTYRTPLQVGTISGSRFQVSAGHATWVRGGGIIGKGTGDRTGGKEKESEEAAAWKGVDARPYADTDEGRLLKHWLRAKGIWSISCDRGRPRPRVIWIDFNCGQDGHRWKKRQWLGRTNALLCPERTGRNHPRCLCRRP